MESSLPSGENAKRVLSVLIVEDEVLIAMDWEFLIEAAGHRVIATTRTADAALAADQMHGPDVALMDLRLAEGSSGIEAGERLLNELNIRCIFLSGNLTTATRARLEPLQPYAMISKPATPTQLLRALDRVTAR